MKKIWSVEDEQSIREILLYTLRSTGYEARGFEDAASFWKALEQDQPDLILLDIMLPESDGIEILNKLRSSPKTARIPVIMTTAKGTEYDKIQALEDGADDYLVKPFGMMEMAARIKAVLRRCEQPVPARQEESGLIESGGIIADPESRKVWLEHKGSREREKIELTRKEFDLLVLFMSHPSRAFSRDELLEQVWDTGFAGETRTVDVHVGSLRTKLKEAGEQIETVRGIGYRYEIPA